MPQREEWHRPKRMRSRNLHPESAKRMIWAAAPPTSSRTPRCFRLGTRRSSGWPGRAHVGTPRHPRRTNVVPGAGPPVRQRRELGRARDLAAEQSRVQKGGLASCIARCRTSPTGTRLRRHRRRSNWRRDGEGLFAEVLTEFLVDGEYFGEYLCPPQPPETLGIGATWWWAAEPDYPPSTCCVRVVRLGCCSEIGWSSEPGAGAGTW